MVEGEDRSKALLAAIAAAAAAAAIPSALGRERLGQWTDLLRT